MGEPPGEVTRRVAVGDEVIRALVHDQFPHLGELEIGRRYIFDDHITVRLGDRLCVNLPTTREADGLVADAAPLLLPVAKAWSFPAGVPLLVGVPSEDYPFHWEVATWLPGSNATLVPLRREAAPDLGRALAEVHAKPPKDAPRHTRVAGPLRRLWPSWTEAIRALREARGPHDERMDPAFLEDTWDAAVEAEEDVVRWTHGNLDPRYVITDRGRFRGICTWFTFGAGDPAADLGPACLLLPVGSEEAFISGYGPVSAPTRARACGYRALRAVEYATSDNAFHRRLGWERLRELADSERSDLRASA